MTHTPLGHLADEVLGHTKTGRPIHRIAGGSTPVVEPAPTPEKTFTEAELNAERERVRQEEKAKLYDQQEKDRKAREEAEAQNAAFQKQINDILGTQKEREAAEQKEREAREAAEKKAREEKMTAEELLNERQREWEQQLAQTQQTWEQKIAAIQQEREQEKALHAKEQEFNALSAYTQRRVAEESENLIPSLVDYIGGNTEQEIEASLAAAKAKSEEIGAQAEQAFAARYQNRGVGTTAPVIGAPDMIPGQTQNYTPEQIAAMPMNEWKKVRAQLGIGGSNNNRGMYG